MLKQKNKDMRHLLSPTEEGVDKKLNQIVWDELRDAVWEQRSVTDDMRYMNTQRILQEIRGQIGRIAGQYIDERQDTMAIHQVASMTENMLQRYRDMGTIQDFRLDSLTTPQGHPDLTASMNLTIVPNTTLERIQMEVRLVP